MYLTIDEKGLTLVEIIITIAIIGIVSVPIFGLQSNNMKINAMSKQQIIATNLAEGKIEQLKHSKEMKLGEQSLLGYENEDQKKNEFQILTNIELIDRKDITERDKEEGINFNELYKITVVVKKDDKVIENLTTYKNSLERSD